MSKRSTSKKSKTDGMKSKTDWKRVNAMRDEDIDFSDNPEMTDEMFAQGVVHLGFKPLPPKQQITLRIDADVLGWFRALGAGYQSQINALLRAYMIEHLRHHRK
ncbi:MAG: uncharacterized protein JWL65_7523 [Gammaproteobacteria bacterium]|nr:uncharacterized protein [Gammaproteobacteria bacterium]